MLSADTLEYLIILVWFLLMLGVAIAEGVLLKSRGWTGMAKGISFAAVTNLIGFMAGGAVLGISFLIMFMMAFDRKMSATLGGEGGMIVLLIVGVVTGPLVLTLAKRLFLLIFKIRSGLSAWGYSLISAVTVIIITAGLPTLLAYLLFRGK